MSAEAVRSVIETSRARGTHLLALIVIAYASPDRGNYPKAEIGFDAIAEKCRISLRRAKAIVADLLSAGRLFIVQKGGGNCANIYEIPVLKTDGVPVLKTTPVVREDPLERAPRADRTVHRTSLPIGDHSSIIRFPVKYGTKGSKSEGRGKRA